MTHTHPTHTHRHTYTYTHTHSVHTILLSSWPFSIGRRLERMEGVTNNRKGWRRKKNRQKEQKDWEHWGVSSIAWRVHHRSFMSVSVTGPISLPPPWLTVWVQGQQLLWQLGSVQLRNRRVPLPRRNCRTRSTSSAATKSTTSTWAMTSLNCKNKAQKYYYSIWAS